MFIVDGRGSCRIASAASSVSVAKGTFNPVAAPEKLAVVGPVPVIAKQGVESFEGVFGAHGDGRHQAPEVRPGGLGKKTTLRTKKPGQTTRYAADGNPAVVLPCQCVIHLTDRPETPHFLCPIRDQNENRSV